MKKEDYLLLITELNNCSQDLKKLGQKADREAIQQMIIKYTKIAQALN